MGGYRKLNVIQTPGGLSNLVWGFTRVKMTQSYH